MRVEMAQASSRGMTVSVAIAGGDDADGGVVVASQVSKIRSSGRGRESIGLATDWVNSSIMVISRVLRGVWADKLMAAMDAQGEGPNPKKTIGRYRGSAAAVATCVAVTLALLVAQLSVGLKSSSRRIGISVREATGGLEVRDVAPASPAERAGLCVGDVFFQVSGNPVANTSDYNRIANGFRGHTPVDYLVRGKGEFRRVAVIPGVPFGWGDYLLTVLTTLAFLGVGLLAFRQRSTDLRARLLFLFSTAVAFEMSMPTRLIGFAILEQLQSVAFYLLTGFQIGVELHLVSLIPVRQRWVERRHWVIPAYYVAGGSVVMLAVTARLTEGLAGSRILPWSLQQADTLVNNIAMPVWACAIVLLLALPAFRFPLPEGRQQAGLVLLGALPWAGIVIWTSVTNLFGSGSPAWVDSLWSPLLLFFPVAVFIAIYRYNLFDLEFVVRRSLIYAALTGLLVFLFYVFLGAGSVVLSEAIGGSRTSVWLVAAATLLLGLLFAPLRSGVQRLIDRTFFPERQSQHERLTALARGLAAQGNLPAMGRHLVAQLQEIFGLRAATLLLADSKSGVLLTLASSPTASEPDLDTLFLLSPDDPAVRMLRRAKRPLPAGQLRLRSASFGQRLHHFSAAVVVPLLTHDRLVGLLLAGGRADGGQFAAEELELLNLFSHNVAAVLENARLFESATYENLTGLLRREAIIQKLEEELERALRYGRPLAIGMADLDEFKAINDGHGHLVGDSMLACVAQAMASALRTSDAVGRYGGDEFLLVLPETDFDGAGMVADKVRDLVGEVRLLTDDGHTVTTSVSIGLASLEEVDDLQRASAAVLIASADRRLFRAKQRGRNCIEPQVATGAS